MSSATGFSLIQIRLAKQDDCQRWNDYVRGNGEASPYHLMAWNLAVEIAYKHKQFYLLAEKQGEIVGVLPLCLLAFPLTKGFLCSLPFCDVGGCLGNTDNIRQQLITAALAIADDNGASTLQLRGRAQAMSENESKHIGKVSMLLSLPDFPDTLFAGFKSKLRSQIRKAEKNGLVFRIGRTRQELADFYQVLSLNMRDIGSPVHSRKWFEAIQRYYSDDMIIGVVSKGGVPIGAGMLLFLGDKAAIPWASTHAKYNRLAPNMLLYWNLLKYATEKRCTIFDFGRSSFGEGTVRCKKQWGAKPVPLVWQNYFIHGEVKDDIERPQSLRKLFKIIWSRLPLRLANTLGPVIRKYISL